MFLPDLCHNLDTRDHECTATACACTREAGHDAEATTAAGGLLYNGGFAALRRAPRRPRVGAAPPVDAAAVEKAQWSATREIAAVLVLRGGRRRGQRAGVGRRERGLARVPRAARARRVRGGGIVQSQTGEEGGRGPLGVRDGRLRRARLPRRGRALVQRVSRRRGRLEQVSAHNALPKTSALQKRHQLKKQKILIGAVDAIGCD